MKESVQARIAMGLLVVAQVVLFGAAMVEARRDGGGDRSPLDRRETGVPAGTPLTIEGGFAGALARAKRWSPDAVLFAAGMQVDWPTDAAAAASSEIPETGWLLYTFSSAKRGVGPKGKASTLSLLIDRKSGVVIGEQEMGWTWAPRRSATITTYPISSSVALFAADATAGNAYRLACPEFRHLSRVSVVPSTDGATAAWLVTYEDQRSAGTPGVIVRVDANSGQVEREEPAVPATLNC
jgi:hypothetical protein